MTSRNPEPVSPLTIEQKALKSKDVKQITGLPRLDGLQVLVVDDERDARDLLSAVLTQQGASVTAVATVAEALEMVQQVKPDVLVSDIAMPGEDGHSLIRKVRLLKESQGGLTPAIALTAHARTSDRIQALSAGYQIHMSKPVEPAELVDVVASLIHSHQPSSSG
jgi:CheY-like chemotaxis protein